MPQVGTLRELVGVGAIQAVAWTAAWTTVQIVRSVLSALEVRAILRRTPDDQIVSVVRALNATRRSAN
jgi:hypothetical protein